MILLSLYISFVRHIHQRKERGRRGHFIPNRNMKKLPSGLMVERGLLKRSHGNLTSVFSTGSLFRPSTLLNRLAFVFKFLH